MSLPEIEGIPYGYCHCGCGNAAPISPTNNASKGYVKGEPRRFIAYHHVRTTEMRRIFSNNAKTYVGSKNPNWRGGYHLSGTAPHIWAPDHPLANESGYVMESRYVAMEMMGRPLTDSEVVWHIDGDARNNDPDNLEVMSNAEMMRRSWRVRRRPVSPHGVDGDD